MEDNDENYIGFRLIATEPAVFEIDAGLNPLQGEIDAAQMQIAALKDVVEGRNAQIYVLEARISELSAQLAAMAEDAVNWVDRKEFDEKMALMDQYGKAQWARRHHSRPVQTVAEWLADLA